MQIGSFWLPTRSGYPAHRALPAGALRANLRDPLSPAVYSQLHAKICLGLDKDLDVTLRRRILEYLYADR